MAAGLSNTIRRDTVHKAQAQFVDAERGVEPAQQKGHHQAAEEQHRFAEQRVKDVDPAVVERRQQPVQGHRQGGHPGGAAAAPAQPIGHRLTLPLWRASPPP